MMASTSQAAEPGTILQAWLPFKAAVGVTVVRNDDDHHRVLTTIDILLDAIGDDETHPLMEVLDYLSDQAAAYEAARDPIPAAKPREVLRFLMDQHCLKQHELAECAPQSRISDILSGRRGISKAIAKRLAARFGVDVAVFL